MKYYVVDFSSQLSLYDSEKTRLTFVFESADPKHELGLHPFFYVNSEEELEEKIELLDTDRATLEEALRL